MKHTYSLDKQIKALKYLKLKPTPDAGNELISWYDPKRTSLRKKINFICFVKLIVNIFETEIPSVRFKHIKHLSERLEKYKEFDLLEKVSAINFAQEIAT